MRTQLSIFLTVVLAIGLTGCRSVWSPTFMPAGYTYHNDEYKAPPGPEADSIGYDYSTQANSEVLQVWRIVVNDLVDQLADQIGTESQRIYIQPLPQQSAFNASYDHVLREELAGRGYVLASHAGNALRLVYEAHVPKDAAEDNKPVYNGDAADSPEYKSLNSYEEFVLILSAMEGDVLAAKAAGVYKLPPFGFAEDDGISLKLHEPIAGGERK